MGKKLGVAALAACLLAGCSGSSTAGSNGGSSGSSGVATGSTSGGSASSSSGSATSSSSGSASSTGSSGGSASTGSSSGGSSGSTGSSGSGGSSGTPATGFFTVGAYQDYPSDPSAFGATAFGAAYGTGPSPCVISTLGACTVYQCDYTNFIGGPSQPYDFGAVTLTGPSVAVDFSLRPDGGGYFANETLATEYWLGGDVITAQASGGVDGPAFSLDLQGPGTLVFAGLPGVDWRDQQVHIDITQPLTFAWTGSSPVGSAVVYVISNPNLADGGVDFQHLNEVDCQVPVDAGAFTLSAQQLGHLSGSGALVAEAFSDLQRRQGDTDLEFYLLSRGRSVDGGPSYASVVYSNGPAFSDDAGASWTISAPYDFPVARVTERDRFSYPDGGTGFDAPGTLVGFDLNAFSYNAGRCGNIAPANPNGGGDSMSLSVYQQPATQAALQPGTYSVGQSGINVFAGRTEGYPDGGILDLVAGGGQVTLTFIASDRVEGSYDLQMVHTGSNVDAGPMSGSFKGSPCL